MISPDGKVLFSNEFENEPTVVHDGRFFVKNGDGLWEMYEASEHPKPIGGEYLYTSGFSHGHALVVERNKPITLINTSAEVVKVLDSIANKKVLEISTFVDGLAVFMTNDSLYGAINEDGDCVIQPEYAALKFESQIGIGIKAKYKKNVYFPLDKKLREERISSILDREGNILGEFKHKNVLKTRFGDKTYAKEITEGEEKDKERWVIYNIKGEPVYQCTKKVKEIESLKGDNFIFRNKEGWGVMNIKGETLIRAKYKSLKFYGDYLVASFYNIGTEEFKLIDIHDNQINSTQVFRISKLISDEYFIAQIKEDSNTDNNKYTIINKSGTKVKNLPSIDQYSLTDGDEVIKSDNVDWDKLLNQLKFGISGIDGFSFNTMPKVVAQYIATLPHPWGNAHNITDPKDWIGSKTFVYGKSIEGVSVNISIEYYDDIARNSLFGNSWCYWNETYPRYFTFRISDYKLKHHYRLLFNKIVAHLEQMGTLAKGNKGAKVFEINNNVRALVVIESGNVAVIFGDINSVDNIDIERFRTNDE